MEATNLAIIREIVDVVSSNNGSRLRTLCSQVFVFHFQHELRQQMFKHCNGCETRVNIILSLYLSVFSFTFSRRACDGAPEAEHVAETFFVFPSNLFCDVFQQI